MQLTDKAVIVHFIGASKPWHSWVQNIDIVKQYNIIKNKSYWKGNCIIDHDSRKIKTFKYQHKSASVAKKERDHHKMIRFIIYSKII